MLVKGERVLVIELFFLCIETITDNGYNEYRLCGSMEEVK